MSDSVDQHLDWIHHSGGSFPTVELPASCPRPAAQGFRGATQWLVLPRTHQSPLRT